MSEMPKQTGTMTDHADQHVKNMFLHLIEGDTYADYLLANERPAPYVGRHRAQKMGTAARALALLSKK